MDAPEVGLDVGLGDMDGRGDDVRGRLAAQLDDVFAKIRLDRLDPRFFERGVEADLLGDHRLALGHPLGAPRLAEAEDDLERFSRGAGVVNIAARLGHLALVGLEIEVEMGEGVILDRPRAVAQRVELRQALDGGGAAADEVARMQQRALQALIVERLVHVFLEMRGRDGGGHGFALSAASPIGGSAVSPASTSATWRTFTARPSRCILPAMLIRQPRSPASSVSAPLAATLALFWPTIASDNSPYLTANVPPKPQHTSASGKSTRRNPSTLASNLRGWLITPISRRPEQES